MSEPPEFSYRAWVRSVGRWIREDAREASRSVRYRKLRVAQEPGCTCHLFSWPWHIELLPPISLDELWRATGQGGGRPGVSNKALHARRICFDAWADDGSIFYGACADGRGHRVERLEPQLPGDHQSHCPLYVPGPPPEWWPAEVPY